MSVKDLIILGCSSQHPTRYRNQSGYLLRWNEEGFLFDPGEGTQRQFIFANVAPSTITRILISHFHGDHCLGLPSIIMRLNLDKPGSQIHCYYPQAGEKFFERLRHSTAHQENIQIITHPVKEDGLVHDDGKFKIEARFLRHSTPCLGWKITEADRHKFYPERLQHFKVTGPLVTKLHQEGSLMVNNQKIQLADVSWIRKGDSFAIVMDTKYCEPALEIASDAKLLLCESTFLEQEKALAAEYNHMTAKEAATIAKNCGVQKLVLTHFSARYQNTHLFLEEALPIFPHTEVAEDLKVILFPK